MTFDEYRSNPGLSFSGMKDLSVSPMRFWFRWINPNRPEPRESPEMRFGSALHCKVLEPDQFEARYCAEMDAELCEGAMLITVDDIRQFIRDKGQTPKGTRKADLILQAIGIDPEVMVFDVEKAKFEESNKGKIRLSVDDWMRVHRAADALLDEPSLRPILSDPDGRAEVPLFAADPNTGVPLKGKLDWWTPGLTLDLKTFSQQRGKSIDRCIHDAIYYEKYHWQAFTYTLLRTLNGDKRPRYLIAFVESDEPHEVRLKELRPTRGEPCLYWVKAEIEVKRLIEEYARCMKRFGDKPWRDEREIEILLDEDIPQTAFASWAA